LLEIILRLVIHQGKLGLPKIAIDLTSFVGIVFVGTKVPGGR